METEETGPLRTCVATGEVKPKDEMLRFVRTPQGEAVFDVAEKLPGRGVWVSATTEALGAAIKGKRFSRGFRDGTRATDALIDQVAAALRKRCLEWLALANKGGLATVGFAKVEPLVAAGQAALLLQAEDAGSDGDKLKPGMARSEGLIFSGFTREELGRPFGRDALVHVALKRGGATEKLAREIRRMAGFCEKTPI